MDLNIKSNLISTHGPKSCRKNDSIKKNKDASFKKENLFTNVKSHPTIYAQEPTRPIHGKLQCICFTPFSNQDEYISSITKNLGLHNLLLAPTRNIYRYSVTHYFAYLFYCSRLEVKFGHNNLNSEVIIGDDRVHDAINTVVKDELEEDIVVPETNKYSTLVSYYKKKTLKSLNDMKTGLSYSLIRITGYVLFKVFNYLFMSVAISEGQLYTIEEAAKKNLPMIFVPLHKSHVDYLFVTWILFNREIPAPIVAAGDNLRMPVFGCLLRRLGGFFIRRKLESGKSRKDYIYRALLQSYMSHALQFGYNLEFFIEGGRTRTGKPCMPKGGLLSVILDAFMNGTLEDALIVPIGINYDILLDGNFIREQMGQNKVPESFWRAISAIVKVLSTNFGYARIDFCEPFSLREFFKARKYSVNQFSANENKKTFDENFSENGKGHRRTYSSPINPEAIQFDSHLGCLNSTPSTSSLFGFEVTEDYRLLVKTLASHILYDAERCQAIMSTNAISWLMSFHFRNGTTLDVLSKSLEDLTEDLRLRNRDVGFSGNSLDATIHAVLMLGSSMIKLNGDLSGDPTKVFLQPITILPNVIELNYYANALAPIFALDAIVATCLVTTADCDLWSYEDINTNSYLSHSKLIDRVKRLCDLMKHEFLYVPPCKNLELKINETIERFVLSGLICNTMGSYSKYDDDDDAYSDDSSIGVDMCYYLFPKTSSLQTIRTLIRSLSYLIDSYYATLCNLYILIGKPLPEKEFIKETQRLVTNMLSKGILLYGESIAADAIRNALKLLESENIVESYTHNSIRLVFLRNESEDQLRVIIKEIESYRI